MILTSSFNYTDLSIQTETPTVVEPGSDVDINLTITALRTCEINHITLEFPDAVFSENLQIEIAQNLVEGQSFEKHLRLTTKEELEGFGEIHINLAYNTPDAPTNTISFANWVSVFTRQLADGATLSDPLRKRLVDVVNTRVRNGHIFLADFVSFFNDFLNVEIPDRIANILSGEFALQDEGLPVDHEKYLLIIKGETTFYGIERLELIYEEHCNESDDKFDMSGAAEVTNPIN